MSTDLIMELRAKDKDREIRRLRKALREIGGLMGMAIHDSQNLLRAVTIAKDTLARKARHDRH